MSHQHHDDGESNVCSVQFGSFDRTLVFIFKTPSRSCPAAPFAMLCAGPNWFDFRPLGCIYEMLRAKYLLSPSSTAEPLR